MGASDWLDLGVTTTSEVSGVAIRAAVCEAGLGSVEVGDGRNPCMGAAMAGARAVSADARVLFSCTAPEWVLDKTP
ncbi:hypothetical protein P3G55_27285, partial [Leptospira sp. 96542]|nr:hypothetical protein [Leptospira sp. 96542]